MGLGVTWEGAGEGLLAVGNSLVGPGVGNCEWEGWRVGEAVVSSLVGC